MKRNKISALVLAAMTCGVVVASVGSFSTGKPKKTADSEKVRPTEGLTSLAPISHANYTPLKTEGNNGVPYGLQNDGVSDRTVNLSWLSPEPVDGYFEDFESHSDFEINSAGNIGWSYIDADNQNTYTWQACVFPNQGQKMAFIVMNPSQTSPATDENPNYKPHSGKKMLVDFCSIDAQNNDYIISPELNFDTDFQISFYARSYKAGDSDNPERVRVGYSTTGKRPSDFKYVNDGPYVELPAEWTLVKYTIPKDAKYVTINCVSDDAFMLLIDDIFIGTNKVRPASRAAAKNPVVGFNVYRNGERITQKPVDAVNFTDNVPDYGDYTYTVTAVQQDGTESAQSEPLKVNVPDVRLLPFEDTFDDWTMHEDKWTTEQLDGSEESKWSIDYYEYGLVDPAATYSWSEKYNYNEGLKTRELHTLDRANTYLRFQLRLRNSEKQNVDYLTVEVTSDGGKTWKEVKTYDNSNGGFEWTTMQFNLSDYLTSDLFNVRFRAHGENAKWINYWYVDDVKIWNPVWASGKLNVTSDAEGNIANCDVTLTSDNGAVVNATTDASGNINLDKIEAGTYTVNVAKQGYNIYNGTWNVESGKTNSFTVKLTKPSVALSATSITADMTAEDNLVKKFSITNNGDGDLTWHFGVQPAKQSGDDKNRWEAQPSFTASSDLQQSVAFDGEFYYTTSSIELGKFWKYDRNGKFIEQFNIPGMYYALYDLTWDGRYFYGSDNSNRLFKLDFDNRRVAGIININSTKESDQATIKSLKITHCSYDPDRKGFWIGGFTTIGFVNMQGKMMSAISSISSSESVAIYGSAYDNVSPGGPYLWLGDMTSASDDQIDKVQIRQYNTKTRQLTDVKHQLTDAPGYVLGTQTTGQNYVCGLFASADVVPGKMTLMGTLNQMPNLIFRYTVSEADKWLSITPNHGTLAPGATQEFSIGFNALEAKMGDKFTSSAILKTNPEMDDQTVSFTLNANAESPTPRPQALAATPGKASATLTWQKGNGSATADGYNIYRNNRRVNAQPVKELSFTDNKLAYGEYTYKVTAVYGQKESQMSDSVKTFVKDGAQYYAPLGVKSSIDGNKNVHLSWLSPLTGSADAATMTWANGKHADEIGNANGGIFYAGAQWDANDCVAYRNKHVKSVAVQIVNPVSYIALIIKKDGTTIYKKQYKGDLMYDGTMTEIPVDGDVTIEPGHTYLFGFQLMNEVDVNPLGVDDTKAVFNKGNMLSMDGTNWFSASISGIDGNFNISVNVTGTDGSEEAPVGYNIYRDGVKVNSEVVSGTKYDDVLSSTGIHNYTITSVYADGGESGMSEQTSVEAYEVADKTAPHNLNATVTHNREISLRWDNPTVGSSQTIPADIDIRPVTTDSDAPEFIRSFNGPKSGMAVATDGTYIYVSIYNEDGRIDKYDLVGNKIGSYKIDDIDGIRNLAFDGEYLYVADNTNYIHRVDPATMKNLENISISEYSRHLAYVPTLDDGNGGFEVGDWETSIYVAKNGSKLGTGPALKGAAGTAVVGNKLYAFEQGNDNKHTIGIYDVESGDRIGALDMSRYLELGDMSSVSAGGMSSFTSKDGITYLLLSLQRQGKETEFVVLDMGGLKTVAGYNVFRNGEKRNSELLTRRYYAETEAQEGTYNYTVQTVYINGETSEASANAEAIIFPTGEAKAPVNAQAKQSTYGYNVLLTFADPDMHVNAAKAENFDSQTTGNEVYTMSGEDYKSGWTVTEAESFSGSKAITADKHKATFAVLNADGMSYLRFAARNANDHEGNGNITVYYSTGGADRENFIRLQNYSTSESWQDILCQLPVGTEYVAISTDATQPQQFIDDVALYNAAPQSNLEGFNVYRNGKKINDELVNGISYVDHNLLPGKYEYEYELVTKTAAVSEKTAPIALDLFYDNGSLAPTNLTVNQTAEGNKLAWQFPALGEPVYLRWHDGSNYKAAGLTNGGAFFAGAKWFASDLKGYGNLALSDVEVYINQVPEAVFLLVYENNTLVRQQFVPTLKQYSFNTIHLDEPLKIDESKDLRVAVYIETNEITVPLGYDHGPARSGRGDLYSSDGTTWTTMEDSGSDVDANWNISIGLSPYSNTLPGTPAKAPRKQLAFTPKANATTALKFTSAKAKGNATSEKNVFQGYNVYRNGDKLNSEMTTDTTFVDTKSADAKYLSYQVSAVYSVAGEKMSDKVTIVATGIGSVNGESGVKVKVEGSNIVVLGAHAGDRIAIYTADGKQLTSRTATDDYKQTLDIASVTTGVYVVKVGSDTFKLKVSRK